MSLTHIPLARDLCFFVSWNQLSMSLADNFLHFLTILLTTWAAEHKKLPHDEPIYEGIANEGDEGDARF